MMVYTLKSKNERVNRLTLKELEDQSTEEKLHFLKQTLNDLHLKIDTLQDQIEASQDGNISKTIDSTLSFCKDESQLYSYQHLRTNSLDNEYQVIEFLGSLVPSPCESDRKHYRENTLEEICQQIEVTQQSLLTQESQIQNNEEIQEKNRVLTGQFERKCLDFEVSIQQQQAQNKKLKLILQAQQKELKQQQQSFENELRELHYQEKVTRNRQEKNKKILNSLKQEKVQLVGNQDQLKKQNEAQNNDLREKIKSKQVKNDQVPISQTDSQDHLMRDLQTFASTQNDNDAVDNSFRAQQRYSRGSIQSNSRRTQLRLDFSQYNKVTIQKIERTEEDIQEPILTPATIKKTLSSIILDSSKQQEINQTLTQSPAHPLPKTSDKRRESCSQCQIF